MRFNVLYQYLTKQLYTPTLKAKCRVYMAKDLRVYTRQYHQVIHQLVGSYWDPVMQNIAYDSLLIKKVAKGVLLLGLALLASYLLI